MPPRDDFIEQQYILRIPPELATRVQTLIIDSQQQKTKDKKKSPNAKNMQGRAVSKGQQRQMEPSLHVQFDSEHHGILVFTYPHPTTSQITTEHYECLIVDMPTVIESYKSLDLETYYKCGQVCKMVLVTTEEFEKRQRDRMRHWIEGDEKGKMPAGSQKETSVSSVSAAPNTLPPHMQHHQRNEQKKEKEREEQRIEAQRKQEQERRRQERARIQKTSELAPHVYHSGITPSLQNIYEHWEKAKITVTKEEVERMRENYFTQIYDEKDFVIEKVDVNEDSGSVGTPGGPLGGAPRSGQQPHGGAGGPLPPHLQHRAPHQQLGASTTNRALSPTHFDEEMDEHMEDMLSMSDERSSASDEMYKEMMRSSDDDVISDDDASSASFDDTRSNASSDDMVEDRPDVQNAIAALGREKTTLLGQLNTANNEAKRLQQQLDTVGANPMLRSQAQGDFDRKRQQIQVLTARLQEVNSRLGSLQGRR